MNSSLNNGNLAVTLPPELLEIIFEIASELEFYDARSNGSTPARLRNFALVCETWKCCAQAILYRAGGVQSYGQWDHCREVVSSNPELASYVCSLHVAFDSSNGRNGRSWSVQDLSMLLQLLPRLTTLTLRLEEDNGGPGYKGDFSALATLPNLHLLDLSSDKFDKYLSSFRQILSSTPNIRSLTLNQHGNAEYDIPASDQVTPVRLPSFVKLSLIGNHFTRMFDKLHLLDEDTLKSVNDVMLLGGRTVIWGIDLAPGVQPYNATGLLRQMGQQITSLFLVV